MGESGCVGDLLAAFICFLTAFSVDGVELIIMIVGTFGQCLSANGHAINIFGVLVVWRFIVCFISFGFGLIILMKTIDGDWDWWRLSHECSRLVRIRRNKVRVLEFVNDLKSYVSVDCEAVL